MVDVVLLLKTLSSNGDNASKDLRKQLLEDCNLFAISIYQVVLLLEQVKTVVLYFEKGNPQKNLVLST